MHSDLFYRRLSCAYGDQDQQGNAGESSGKTRGRKHKDNGVVATMLPFLPVT